MLVREPVECLECGLAGRLYRVVDLPRHLAAMHALTVEEYRARWTPRRREPVVTAALSDAEQARQQQRDYRARRRRR
jgi:predicted transcriptional regulator